MADDLILITGAGGFIGGGMVAGLRRPGHTRIRAADIKQFGEWYQGFDDVENLQLDLNLRESCEQSARGARDVYNFAANMGGMGGFEHQKSTGRLFRLLTPRIAG